LGLNNGKTKMFHVMTKKGEVKEITQKEYLAHLNSSWLVGYVDKHYLLLAQRGTAVFLSRKQLEKILALTESEGKAEA